MLLVAVTSPFDVLSAGIAQATVKHLAAWLPAGRISEARLMIRLNYLLNLGASVVTITALFFAAPVLATEIFKISPGLQGDAILSFRLAALLWTAKLIAGTSATIAIARQDFKTISLAQIVSQSALYLGGIPIANYWGSVSALQIWSILTSFALIGFWIPQIVSAFGFSALLPKFDRSTFQRSFGFSFWQMMNAFLSFTSQQADRIFVGMLLGTAATAILGISMGIQQRLVTLCWSFFGTLFPALSRQTLDPAKEEILFSDGAIIMLASCTLCGTGVIFAYPFCHIWLGESQARSVAPLLKILFFVAIAGLPYALFLQYILALGKTKLLFIGNIAFASVSAVTSFYFISNWGLSGAVYGPLFGLLSASLPIHYWVCRFSIRSGNSVLSRMWSVYSLPVLTTLVLLSLTHLEIIGTQNEFSIMAMNSLMTLPLFIASLVLLDYIFSTHRPVYRELIRSMKLRFSNLI